MKIHDLQIILNNIECTCMCGKINIDTLHYVNNY